jgi:NTE family protein
MTDVWPKPKEIALVLAGAVAKGAFEAGVVDVIAKSGIRVRRIIASSSGALNGVVVAAGVRANELPRAAAVLLKVWTDEADFAHGLHLSLMSVFRGVGLSDQSNLRALLRKYIEPVTTPERAQVELRLVVAPLRGSLGRIGAMPATTFERALDFRDDDFDAADSLEQIFDGVVASAAFPGLFAPVPITVRARDGGDDEDLGPCLDGGVVNNIPIHWAVSGEAGRAIDAIFVVVPAAAVSRARPEVEHGLPLLAHLADMLVQERLYRDLRAAEQINSAIRFLDSLGLERELRQRIVAAFVREDARVLDVIPIRPEEDLRGGAFDGIFSTELRVEHIDAGRRAAEQLFRSRGWE